MAKHQIYTTKFASVYPLYVAKAEKKGRTNAEVDQVIAWLTGYVPGCVRTRTIGAPIACAAISPRIWRTGAAKLRESSPASI